MATSRGKTFTYTTVSAAAYPWIPLDHRQGFFAVRWNVVKTLTGDVTYSIQGTIDNVLGGATAVAIDEVSAKTTSLNGTIINAPYTAVRFNPTAVSGAVNIAFTLLQTNNGD